MKFSLEGTPDEIEDFLYNLFPSSEPVSVPPDHKGLITGTDIKPEKKEIILPEVKKNLSVPKAPEIAKKDQDIKLEIQKLPTKEDIIIPRFQWPQVREKYYNRLVFAELEDGRVMLSYMSARIYTTKEKVLQIPYPVPSAYRKGFNNPNHVTALRQYRQYLAENISVHAAAEISGIPEDRIDPDAPFKPMLNGVFTTHPDAEEKIEGTLEV